MDSSINWFISMASLSTLAWAAGIYLGRGPAPWGRLAITIGVILLICWTWLIKNPSVAVHAVPLDVLSHIEGVASVPIFMLIIGAAWSRCQLPRQRHIVIWAGIFGFVFFLQNGWWLLQETPKIGFTRSAQGMILQSQDYSCVPAACATALNLLGVASSEAEMARLTNTRPLTGSTTIRAMAGLQKKLKNTDYMVELIEPDYEQLLGIATPIITPLQLEASRLHMVTVLKVYEDRLLMADPAAGRIFMKREEFLKYYRYQALAFTNRN